MERRYRVPLPCISPWHPVKWTDSPCGPSAQQQPHPVPEHGDASLPIPSAPMAEEPEMVAVETCPFQDVDVAAESDLRPPPHNPNCEMPGASAPPILLKNEPLSPQAHPVRVLHVDPVDDKMPASPEKCDLEQKNPECAVCWDDAPTHVCVPCGHKCVCKNCAGELTHCPVCRAELEGKKCIRVFNVCEAD